MTTAFERTLLPGFARWFVERVESCRPDYLVPAETKGARLLDVVLDYARDELGTPIQVPVLYRSALAYLSREELAGSRVLVLDDAWRTGSNFNRHRRRLEEFGATDVQAAICICHDPEGNGGDDSYLCVEDVDEYRNYICQMTELVVASGLPPEVDHHVFELELPGLLQFAWGELEAALGGFGQLSVDAPASEWGALRPMTLHFPELPGTVDFPMEGAVRNDGPRKVRLFPDEVRNRVYAVPVSFPALDLDLDGAATLSLASARAQAREWSGSNGSIGELLVGEATERDAETVFRALSAFAEVDLACGLARVLAGTFGAESISIDVQRSLVDRLYGAEVGARVADAIEAKVERALTEPVPVSLDHAGEPRVPLFLDERVVRTTNRTAAELRELATKHLRAGGDPAERVGRSLPGISTRLEAKRLLVSRCIDFGLALTTLVPYVDVEQRGEGLCRAQRKYRVSEQGGLAPDRQRDNQRLAEEIFAYTALHFGKRSERYAGRPLPLRVANWIAAILRPVFDSLHVEMHVNSTSDGLSVDVRRGSKDVPVASAASSAFQLVGDDDSIVPTRRFLAANASRTTEISKRGIAIMVEGFLDALIPLLDSKIDEDELEELLYGAAMSNDERLGLTHVQMPVEIALERLEVSLRLIVRETDHDGSDALRPEVRKALDLARSNLDCWRRTGTAGRASAGRTRARRRKSCCTRWGCRSGTSARFTCCPRRWFPPPKPRRR